MAAELQPVVDLIAWHRVELTAETVYLPLKGMELDLGGVVKEYVADALNLLARSQGISHGLINLGGDICIFGAQPGAEPW